MEKEKTAHIFTWQAGAGEVRAAVTNMLKGQATSFLVLRTGATPLMLRLPLGLHSCCHLLRMRGTYRRSSRAWLAIIASGTL